MRRSLPGAIILLCLTACVGPSARARKSLASLLAAGDYAGAAHHIKARQDEYGPSNSVLYHLDLGLALHYAGRNRESAASFEAAEERLAELYTHSASAAAGRLLANENIKDYRGQPSERVWGQFFDALNYLFLGKMDEALVAARRMEVQLDELGRIAQKTSPYKDDGLARYFSALIYHDAGKIDDARISYEAAGRARGHFIPELSMPEGMGELVFFHYNGPAPRRVSVRSVAEVILQTAHPEYVQDSFRIAGSWIEAGEKNAETELYTDVYAIADRGLRAELTSLKARSTLRATLKLAQQAATGVEASGSEFADLRFWALLPAQIRVARLALKPGVHRVAARYRDAQGGEVSSRTFEEIVIRAGRRTWLADRTGA